MKIKITQASGAGRSQEGSDEAMSYPDHKNKEHREAIRRNLSNCGSGVIEDACDMIDSLEQQLAAANARVAELEADRAKPWRHKLLTAPLPDPPGTTWPTMSEDYELTIKDTGHSDRVLLLASKALDDRIQQLESTIAACKAAGKNQPVRHHTEWHEGDGPVLWFDDVKSWEDVESLYGAYFGTPLCSDAPADEMHWWIPFPDFSKVIEAAEAAKGGREG